MREEESPGQQKLHKLKHLSLLAGIVHDTLLELDQILESLEHVGEEAFCRRLALVFARQRLFQDVLDRLPHQQLIQSALQNGLAVVLTCLRQAVDYESTQNAPTTRVEMFCQLLKDAQVVELRVDVEEVRLGRAVFD